MDATANDVPSTYEVRGFPTLYWIPKDSTNPVRYEVRNLCWKKVYFKIAFIVDINSLNLWNEIIVK